MANNLVDLKLLNTAYGINKKRIDNLKKKIKTEELIVEATTTNGTLTVNSGAFTTNTLEVNGGMVVNGGGVTLPEGKALSLNDGGSVTGTTTLDTLTGAVKFGNAVSNGNVTGSAQIVVPERKSLSLSGSAITNENTTIEGTITSANITASGSAVLEGSTIKSATIQNGTIDLNSKNLTVTSNSTITNTTSGSTITLNGVGAIDAKSMTLGDITDTTSTALYILNKLGKDNPTNGVALKCEGGISAAKVYNSVWNDLADSIEVPSDTELEYGYCYKYKDEKVYKTDEYADPNVLGIHSDTAGMVLGIKPSHIKCINLAVAGVVLAYVDKEYECGTALVATKGGMLTKANRATRLLHPERIVATYYKKEKEDLWGPKSNRIKVNGRSWVKIK